MIDAALRWIVARLWRQRIARSELRRDAEFAEWKHLHPNSCMYCAYTLWANLEHGQNLKLAPHHCVEGNSPPHPLPKAKVIVCK